MLKSMKSEGRLKDFAKCLLGILAIAAFISGPFANAEEKKTRRVPAISQSLYKQISEAQIMIDPESMPREEGEPPPVPKGTPRDG
ncbi:MAG: hypothetical protein VW684_13675, partial [Betaproteobacteria bacterium]